MQNIFLKKSIVVNSLSKFFFNLLNIFFFKLISLKTSVKSCLEFKFTFEIMDKKLDSLNVWFTFSYKPYVLKLNSSESKIDKKYIFLSTNITIYEENMDYYVLCFIYF